MITVELFNRKTRTVVDSLVDPNDDDAINKWLVSKSITLSDGKVMDVRTLPFGKTNFILRRKGEAIDPPPTPTQNPFLDALREQLEAYRIAKNEAKDLVVVLAGGLQEAVVRGAIEDCRKNGISEENIIAILGENANLAEDGTRVEMVVTSR